MNNLAFVLACQEYEDPYFNTLDGVERDAQSMREVLKANCDCKETVLCAQLAEAGYKPTSPQEIKKMIVDVAKKYETESFDNLYFYFSGHGFRMKDTTIIALSETEIQYEFTYLPVKTMIQILNNQFHVKNIICFLDMCRSDLAKGESEEVEIKNEDIPDGAVVFYSCAQSSGSYLIPERCRMKYGQGSIYTSCLAKALAANNCVTVADVDRVTKEKMKAVCRDIFSNEAYQLPKTALEDRQLTELIITDHHPMMLKNKAGECADLERFESVSKWTKALTIEFFDALSRKYPEASSYQFIHEIHITFLKHEKNSKFRQYVYEILREDVEYNDRNMPVCCKTQETQTRDFIIYYCLCLYAKRQSKVNINDPVSLKNLTNQFGHIFKDFPLHLETYSWYCRRMAGRKTSSADEVKKFLQKADSHDKDMMKLLPIKVNAGIYVSFASTVSSKLESEFSHAAANRSMWESTEQRMKEWKDACGYMPEIIEQYKKTWHTASDYGKHHFVWGKLLLFAPNHDSLPKNERLDQLRNAWNQFNDAEQCEEPDDPDHANRITKYREYLKMCESLQKKLETEETLEKPRIRLTSSHCTKINRRPNLCKPNEDMYFCDQDHRIFLIADGVTRPHEEYKIEERKCLAANCAYELCMSVRDYLVSKEELLYSHPEDTICDALLHGNQRVKRFQDEEWSGGKYPLCATFICVVFVRNRMYFYNCCDTVGYLLREGVKIQFTEYYNWHSDLIHYPKETVYRQVQNNLSHPAGFGIFNGDDRLRDFIHISHIEVEAKDRIVIASDGLAQYLKAVRPDALMQRTASQNVELSEQYDKEPYQAYADDKTCIVIDIE